MLRQSVMGSDLSYEDMMENSKLLENYDAAVVDSEEIDGRDCWILELHANSDDVNYQIRKIWVDKTRFVLLKEELYAKSGKAVKENRIV